MTISRNSIGILCVLMVLLPVRLAAQQTHSNALDDIVQHVPMASVVVLRTCGVGGQAASWGELAMTAGAGYVLAAATTYGLKRVVSERRPDKSDRRSFPSGHATIAFAGATALRHEYGRLSPWVSIGGYALATITAADRVRRDRHYLHDVCAGAAIGFAATELSYYVRRHFIKNDHMNLTFTGQSLELAVRW